MAAVSRSQACNPELLVPTWLSRQCSVHGLAQACLARCKVCACATTCGCGCGLDGVAMHAARNCIFRVVCNVSVDILQLMCLNRLHITVELQSSLASWDKVQL